MTDKLKAMINSIINNDVNSANLDMHTYVTEVAKEKLAKVARKVPAGTFGGKPKESDQITDFKNVKFDPANPRHQDEKKRRDAEAAKRPKYTEASLKAKAEKIAKEIRKDAEKYDEIGPSDLIDSYVDMHVDPELWDAVMELLILRNNRE